MIRIWTWLRYLPMRSRLFVVLLTIRSSSTPRRRKRRKPRPIRRRWRSRRSVSDRKPTIMTTTSRLKHAQGFLKDGNKVKAYVFFRGRSIVFKEQGELLLARFAEDLAEFGRPEAVPKLEGKRMILFLSPKK